MALTALVWLIAAAMLAYAAAIWLSEPALGGGATGPYGASSGAMIGLQALAALVLAVLASASVRRGLPALRP